MIPFILKVQIIFFVFQKFLKKYTWMYPTIYTTNMQKSCSSILYSELHKHDKRVDLNKYIFKFTNLSDFIIFL
jgi:hypothetical protein